PSKPPRSSGASTVWSTMPARRADGDRRSLWQQHIQINQYGCFLGMKAVVPAMERSGGGSIVNISSIAGFKESPGSFAYAATKWALRGVTKSAAIDLSAAKSA